ncbi:MAG: FtsX-like permease family protein, partial [Tissierellia bacterium]|nr:FtsX-like permease family protein [Tissierellia bacterium]
MKKNALYKDIFREINKSKGRFASIMLMLAVGVLIFVGLKVSGPSMKKTGEDYMAKANPPDIMIESTHGLTDEDIQRIEKIGDIEDLELGYQIDLTDQKGEAIRVENLNDKISLTDVVKGRIPEKENEILFDETLEEEGYEIGDIVTFEQEVLNEHLKQEVALSRYEFEIVGFGTNAEYLITEYKGNSNAGDGNLKGFALVRPEVFLKENPDIARITFKGLNGKDAADEEYRHLVLPYEEKVREEFKGRPGQRLLSMQDEITDEIRDGEEKIKDAREKIADGEQAIQDAKRELQEGREEYYVNEEKFNDEIRNAREKIRNGEQEIASNEQKLIDGENTWKNSQREWESGKKAYEEGEAQWKESQKQIRAGKSEIEKAEEQLKQGRIELEEAKNSLGDQKEELEIAKQRIQEKEKELAIKKREWESKGAPLRQAKAQLDQGKKELDQGESKIQESQEKINEYYNGVSELQEKHGFVKGKLLELEGTISSLENQLSGLDPQIDEEKYMQLAAQIDELKKKKAELTETLQGIEKKQQDLQQKKPEIEAAEKQLTIEKEKLKSAKAQWEAQYSQFQEQNKPYFEAGERIRQGEEELQEAKEKIEKGQTDIENAPEIIAAKEKEIEEAERALGEKKKEWEAGNQKLQEARAELDQSKKELDQGQQQLADSKQELENNREKLQNAKADLQNAKEELATNQREGRQKLDDALSEIRDGEGELASEEEKFNREKADALVDIEEGEKDLADARDALTMIKKPVYSIVAQSDIDEIATYFDSTGRLDIISNIFPILFFFIAILVSLTTMTRMVDENRGQMGIMKGLGYPPMEIMKKYFIYGALASILGSIIGIIIGHVLIAKVIANAYVSSFIFKDVEVIFSLKYSIIALIIGVLSTAIVASTVAWKSLKKKPATLMRPKAPKSGSRILLERVTPIWKRLSFIQKVTFRNLFRYKKRMWMTIIGIAGCTGLMFMGFAIRDSVSGISDKQYGEIFNFQYITLYDRDLGKEEFKDYKIHL